MTPLVRLDNSPLVQSVIFANGADTKLTTTKVYDNLNRLTSITNTAASGAPLPGFTYGYNSANQRIKATREDGSYWNYGYDSLGQVTSGTKFLSDGTPVLGHSFGWSYDDIGNRKTSTDNGQSATYNPSSLNQYAQRTVPGMASVLGASQPDATVKVTAPGGTPTAVTRQGELFSLTLPVDNTASAVSQQLEIDGVKNNVGSTGEDAVTSFIRHALVPKTPEHFTYDLDGNLTADSRWTYVWDGENRLIGMTAKLEAIRGERRPRQIGFTYDAQGRRVQKKVTSSSAVGVALRAEYFSQPLLQGTVIGSEETGSLDTVEGNPSAEWTGTLQVPASGAWTIKLDEAGNRGYRFWLDGVVRFSSWPASGGGSNQFVSLNLEAGKDYAVRVDYTGTNGLIRLKWSGPGTAEQDIPSAWSPTAQSTDTVATTNYVYDGWNLLEDLDGQSADEAICAYVWGLDFSGSMQDAGGVGGLLFTNPQQPSASSHSAASDGNGNVIGYVDMATGAKSATYEYNAFGETIIADGPAAALFPFRFSTKYQDVETGFYNYGYRIYQPSTGRWLSRDPIGEQGGANLYGFVGNEPLDRVDPDGRKILISTGLRGGEGLIKPIRFASSVMTGIRQVVGDSGTIGVEPVTDADGNVIAWKVVIRSEKPNGGGCSKCWQQLKEAINADFTVNIRYNYLMLDNGTGDTTGSVRNVDINPDNLIHTPEVRPGFVYNGANRWDYENKQQPFGALIWHEAIGHATLGRGHPNELWNYLGKTNSPQVDPTIEIENIARDCLRKNGFNVGDRYPKYYGFP